MKAALIISLVIFVFKMTCEIVENAAKPEQNYITAIFYGLMSMGNLIALPFHKEITEFLIKPS